MAKSSIFLAALCVFAVMVLSSSTAKEEDCDDPVDPQIDEWTKTCVAALQGKDSAAQVEACQQFLATEVTKCCDAAHATIPEGCDRRTAAINLNQANKKLLSNIDGQMTRRITSNNSPENQQLVCDECARDLAEQCGSCSYLASLANGTIANQTYCYCL